MKKRVIALAVVGVLAISSVVSAASMWGTYKGNDVIRLTVNGAPVKVSDVPAISYNNRTMIPINLLNQAGINYTWDQSKQTVDIKKTKSDSIDIVKMTKNVMSFGGGGITLTEIAGDITAICYYKPRSDFKTDFDYIYAIFIVMSKLNAPYLRVAYGDNDYVEINTETLNKFVNGSITKDQLNSSWMYSQGLKNTSNSTSTTTAPSQSTLKYPLLYSNDGRKYLGKLTTNTYDTDSIFNEYGNYGSKYSASSIWNEYGTYGSPYSSESAFNKYASSPPEVILNGSVIGYLTVNTSINNAINPNGLYSYLKNLGY